MKKLLAFICLCIQIVPIMDNLYWYFTWSKKSRDKSCLCGTGVLLFFIIRVKKYPLGQAPEKQSLSVTMQPEKVKYKIQEANNQGNTYYFRN